MFRLLLKHDWKSIRGILGLLCLICLGAGFAGGFALRLLIISATQAEESAFQMLMSMLSVMVCYIAIVICAAGTLFFCIWRFYKSRYSDEGYMTFTLPVSTHQILLSSLTSTLLAMLCAVAAVLLSLTTAFCIGMTAVDSFFADAAREIPLILEEFKAAFRQERGMFLTLLAYTPTAALAEVLIMMLCVTVGSVAVRKLKVLAAIGVYYGINVVISGITTTIMFLGGVTATSGHQLLNHIWGYDFDGASRTVDVHIRTLRQKLGDSGECIETVRGVGYKIAEG